MPTTRFAIPVCILLFLALIPTVIHGYLGIKASNELSSNKIPASFENFDSIISEKNKSWGMDIFGTSDWIERIYQDLHYRKVRLFTASSYDHKRLYHHPELALSYGQILIKQGIVHLKEKPEIPIHFFNTHDKTTYVAYVLLYDGEYIANPIMHQLKDSIRLFISPRKSMRLIYASQQNVPYNRPFEQTAIAELLIQTLNNLDVHK